MRPEVFGGQLTDWSDQFSFAVSYHVLRTGRFPFPTPPTGSRGELARGYQRPDPDLSSLSVVERAAVARALSPIPQQRFPTCGHFMSAVLASLRLRSVLDADGAVEIRPMGTGSGSSTELII